MNNINNTDKSELYTNIEDLHIKWIQTMFQMVTVGFVAITFIKKSGKKLYKYMFIPRIIGILSIILGLYSIYYSYMLDNTNVLDIKRINISKYMTIFILLCLLFISTSIFIL